ncbi:MAG: elongator complex 1 [Lasallia pustulata]|uniref:Elongator complex protein 1 n=1 Tax=Lasallia pustulata TaxID=136370 RepID=A0A5M8PN70_9LECA|nr:MAG: elongator complex 1 [Lasallia pustulata]
MRNLKNIHCSVLEPLPGCGITAATWDVATDSVVCAFGPTKNDILIQLKRWVPISGLQGLSPGDALHHIASWDAPCPLPYLECDKIVDLHFFSDSLTSCLVLAGGDIVVIREEPQSGEDKIEIVGSVDAGISGAAWSPDEELLAITTQADTLLYMTRDFENVTDITLSSEDLKASKHVSVGWGKSETQFKGKRAKALQDPTVPEKVDEGSLSHHDGKNTTISWRGDGAYVAVNSIDSGSRRVVRVYSREGSLDSVSEPVNGLEGSLSWRPAGNLLASIQRLEDRIDVVFFERNGLRHGQFSLRLSKEEMESWGTDIEVSWNVDSTVLAVCFKDRVQLWTMGNYHYYLKQEIALPATSASQEAALFTWHPEKPLRFAGGSEAGLRRLEYTLAVAAGPTALPNDYGVVAVIDGKIVKLTAFRIANVPPPMASHDLVLASNVVDIAVTGNGSTSCGTRIAVLHSGEICLYEWKLQARLPSKPSLISFVELPSSDIFQSMNQQIVFMDNYRLLVWLTGREGSSLSTFVTHANTVRYDASLFQRGVRSLIAPAAAVREIGASSAFIFLDNNEVRGASSLFSKIEGQHPLGSTKVRLPTFTPRTEVVEYCGKSSPRADSYGNGLTDIDYGHLIAFGLTDDGFLYANEKQLARNCTSFLVTPAHLIFTTTQHLVKFVHMATVDELEIPPDTPETDERCRSIERGAKLVTVMPSIFALVMQMPRGNLETIYPRALVLAGIRQNVNDKEYKKAFLACRNHRVDMNILHDHAPQRFMEDVALFVDQVKKVEHIDLFLSQLKEEDVSQTMYMETIRANVDQHLTQGEATPNGAEHSQLSKVNKICDAFLRLLEARKASNLQNMITAHVCKSPPHLEAGLLEIAKLRKDNSEHAERAIEHICFLADVNKLYDTALGLYDLDLTLEVAQQSQKDPREYLPFLQSLQESTTLRSQYTIDNHLGRYKKALQHLYELGVFDEMTLYTQKHSLYVQALDLYRYQEDSLRVILRLYAEYLQRESKNKEAGIAYEYLLEHESASECYRLAHLWKESLSCATLVPLPQPQLHDLARTLADSLVETKEFFAAATIHLDYLSDVETAARFFCKGYFFADALRIVGLHQRYDLLGSIIDTGLVDGMATMTELLAECKSQLNAQIPRIRELRTKKAEDPLAFLDGDVNGGVDVPDNVSLAPTDTSTAAGGSLFTRYTDRTGTVGTNATRRTSKNRRREERKRARGKKGSVYEEEYLINSVGRLIDRVNVVGEEVARLVVGLMRRGMRERARAVESAMVDVVALCQGCVKEVFQVKEQAAAGLVDEERGRPKGGDGVLWDSVDESQARRDAPPVKDFGKLSLLSS